MIEETDGRSGDPLSNEAALVRRPIRLSTIVARAIAALEVFGGIAGMVMWFLGPSISQGGLFSLLILAGFALGILAGVLLWDGVPWGIHLSRICQFAQIPLIISNPVIFDYFLGVRVSLVWLTRGFLSRFDFGAGLHIYYQNRATASGFGINLVAILALLCLFLLVSPSKDRPSPTAQHAISTPPGAER